MTQKNLELQQQALMLIMKQYGQIPEVMQPAQSEKPEQKLQDASTPPKGKRLCDSWRDVTQRQTPESLYFYLLTYQASQLG